MSMLANAMRYLSLLPVSAMSNARRVQPLRATQLRGARTNCEYRGAKGARIRWNEVPLAFATAKRPSLGRTLGRLACAHTS
jgi:hypothetical protein